MNHRPDHLRLSLFANWMLRPRTLGEFIDGGIGFLKRLQPLHPLFREGLHFLGNSRKNSPALDADLTGLEQLVLRHGWNTSAEPTCCDHLDSTGMPTRQSTSNLGFWFSVNNLRPHQSDHLQIRFSGDSTDPGQGGVGIELPYAGGLEFEDPAFLRELLRVAMDYWKPEQAGIYNLALNRGVRIERSYATAIGWLNYLDDAQVVEALPPDIHHEPFGPGVLFSLQPEPPLTNVEQTVQKAIRVRDALLPGRWMVQRYWRAKK